MTMNDYMLRFEDRGNYLFAHIKGKDSFSASLRYWNDIADQVERLGHRKLLVHEDLEGEVSGREIYDLISDLKDSVLKEVKIAFYDENNSDWFLNHLGKLLANYRGAKVRIFKTLYEAQWWIERNA